MTTVKEILALPLAALITVSPYLKAANHREAPITALDHKADITDFFAFVSYGPNQPHECRRLTLLCGAG
jgi:hypothetical protein